MLGKSSVEADSEPTENETAESEPAENELTEDEPAQTEEDGTQ